MTGDDRVALVKRLREQASAYGHHRDDRDTWGKAADEIERLSAIIVCERIEHAKAQRDTERLDWLDRSWTKIHRFPDFNWMHPNTGACATAPMQPSELYLRAAIDAARGESDGG